MKIPYSTVRRRSLSINMTPMIDVVFLLIIFFLVSSHLARRENELPLDLPVADTGEELDTRETARLTLNIESDGRMTLGGSRIPAAGLAQRLVEVKDRQGKDVELRIRADRSVPYRQIWPILRAAADQGIWNVSFSVIRGTAGAGTGEAADRGPEVVLPPTRRPVAS